ncbi:acyl-CoA dehydrogenase family protein [Bradyrhizobium sp. 137]|uniref:acyl-CoA dehydrogenase family protein n=1 Tax=Bradyrhizobium sp. 137 TaxID=2782614 RepID=UPI001FF954FA|nr:acyl-CoA dehydrogenase family protein [Bradyrhizobium sp. 137]
MPDRVEIIAAKIEAFIRTDVIPYEKDPRTGPHGPSDELVQELRAKARKAGVLTPHILPDGSHLTQVETAKALIKSGLSPLGPLACNTMAPDEGNMYLLGKVGSAEQKARFLEPLVSGKARSAFFMTEPADEGGAGSAPSMMQTTCRLDGNHWVINGRKKFITGAEGAQVASSWRNRPTAHACFSSTSRTPRSAPCGCWIRSIVRCPADTPRSR